jgi:hypothetical protein
VLRLRDERAVKTVTSVHVACGPGCASSEHVAPGDDDAFEVSFGAIDDVFDYVDRLIAAHDWERGTVQRLSRVLAELHRKRGRVPSQ